MLCPVCLIEIGVTDGVVDKHVDVLGRGTFCPMSGREPFVWSETSTRQAVPNRSGGRCEYCGDKATEMHHRKARSQGGLWSPANILHICWSDHRYFTDHPTGREMAYKYGVCLRRHEDPGLIPVQTRKGLLWLSDDVAPPFPGWAR